MKKESNNAQLYIRLKEDELQQIKKNAAACGRTTSAYIRETALNMCVLETDYQAILDHTNELSAFRNTINQLVFTIRKTENYTPKDLEYILDKVEDIFQSEIEFLSLMDKAVDANQRMIGRSVRKLVNEKLKK